MTTMTPNATSPDGAAPASHHLTLPWVKDATNHFVHADDMRAAISLALAAGFNLVLSGPGGHAKSEFLTAVFGAISGTEPYVKSLGSGTTMDDLYGGIDLTAMRHPTDAVLQYNTDRSFLGYPLVVLEEGFDAPPRVLASLKDTLTARELRNGCQRAPLRSSVIAIATNKSPQDIAAIGPEVAALIERFPIQIEVKWASYAVADFTALFSAVEAGPATDQPLVGWEDLRLLQQQVAGVLIDDTIKAIYAQLIHELRREKVFLSPRTAVLGLRLIRAAAAINGRDHADADDLRAITYLPGVHTHTEFIVSRIAELRESVAVELKLNDCDGLLDMLIQRAQQVNTFAEFDDCRNDVVVLRSALGQLIGDNSQLSRIRQLKQQCDEVDAVLNTKVKAVREAEAKAKMSAKAPEHLAQAEVDITEISRRLRRRPDSSILRQLQTQVRDLQLDMNLLAVEDEALQSQLDSVQSRLRVLEHQLQSTH